MTEKKKAFADPELEIIKYLVEDVITTSFDPDDEEWGAGEF